MSHTNTSNSIPVPQGFLPVFHMHNSLFWQWEFRVPVSSTYVLIWSTFLYITNLLSSPPPHSSINNLLTSFGFWYFTLGCQLHHCPKPHSFLMSSSLTQVPISYTRLLTLLPSKQVHSPIPCPLTHSATHSGFKPPHWVQECPPHSLGYKTPCWATTNTLPSMPLPKMHSFLTLPGI